MSLFIVEFDLKTKSPIIVENGDVILDKGWDTVTVRNVEADSIDDAAKKARPTADTFLNELSWQYGINLQIGSGLSLALQASPTTRHVKTIRMTLKVKGGHRKKYPPVLKGIEIKPSDSKAYFRKANISKDPFDKFRNLYLAAENVASKIAAIKIEGVYRDSELLEIALRECFSSDYHLLEDYSHIRGFKRNKDIIKDVATFLYKEYRCALNHAKADENKKIPFDSDDELEVLSAIPLMEVIVKSLVSYEDTLL